MSEVSLKLLVGEQVTEFFLIRGIEMKTKKSDNAPYLTIELGYEHGRIWSNIWNNPEEFASGYSVGDIVKVQGIVEKYRDQVQINMIRIRKAVDTDNVYPEDLLPKYPGDMEALKTGLSDLVNSINSVYLRELCRKLLLDGEFGKRFQAAPGGKLWHHSYVGGLMEHTVSVTELAVLAAEHYYPECSRDLLCSGGLLHDIGKVESYSISPFIDYTDEGRLHGHIVQGYEIVSVAIREIEDFPDEERKQLLHLILSHQGKLENASPVVPMTFEALILHHADEMDAHVNAFRRIRKEQHTPGTNWSSYVNLADRFFYFGSAEEQQST